MPSRHFLSLRVQLQSREGDSVAGGGGHQGGAILESRPPPPGAHGSGCPGRAVACCDLAGGWGGCEGRVTGRVGKGLGSSCLGVPEAHSPAAALAGGPPPGPWLPPPLAHPDHFGHPCPCRAVWGRAWLGDQEEPPSMLLFRTLGKDYEELTICSSNVLQFSWKWKGFQRDPGRLVCSCGLSRNWQSVAGWASGVAGQLRLWSHWRGWGQVGRVGRRWARSHLPSSGGGSHTGFQTSWAFLGLLQPPGPPFRPSGSVLWVMEWPPHRARTGPCGEMGGGAWGRWSDPGTELTFAG